eukprot:scaffold369957_cov45-Prasinocladus_malaysianus.AAC.1
MERPPPDNTRRFVWQDGGFPGECGGDGVSAQEVRLHCLYVLVWMWCGYDSPSTIVIAWWNGSVAAVTS